MEKSIAIEPFGGSLGGFSSSLSVGFLSHEMNARCATINAAVSDLFNKDVRMT
jgi:hypothetical protein